MKTVKNMKMHNGKNYQKIDKFIQDIMMYHTRYNGTLTK